MADQPLSFRVLDSRDRPLTTARLTVEPLAGRPAARGPYQADEEGVIHLMWRPQVIDEMGPKVSDRVYLVRSALNWRVEAPGCFPALGTIDLRDKSRQVQAPELKALNRQAKISPYGTVVVLRRLREVWGGGLAGRPDGDPLKRACLAFAQSHGPVANRLGASWAWPAFVYEGRTLTLRLEWLGAPWRGAEEAPLAARVGLMAGLPLFMAAGQELLPLPGVENLSLVFLNKYYPGNDEHAMAKQAQVTITAPAASVQALAQGRLGVGPFLAAHPPALRKLDPGDR
ncbi:MAG: hypothetical protein C4525_01575 [Desulfarculus sp.]|nr:MAG: hypothetical protein C4525_01575 [Desulfarculus sp.]